MLYHWTGRGVASTGWACECMDPSHADPNPTNVLTHSVAGDNNHLPDVAPAAFCANI